MADPFESPKRQLKRGKRDIARIEKRFQTFLKQVRHTQLVELNADGSEYLVKIRFTKRIPVSVSETAYTAIDALRSALDQVGYSAAIAAGKVNPKKTHFPFGDDAAGLENTITGHKACKDIPAEIVALFRSFQPYKGGNDALWALNKLRHSFHTAIIPTNIHTGGMHIEWAKISGPSKIFLPRYDADKNEIIIASLGTDGKFEYKGRIALTISFDTIELLEGAPIFDVLRAMTAEVERVLVATEAECRRIGFIT